MNLKKIRKNAKKNLKNNYLKSVLVCFVVTFLLTGGISYTSKNILDIDISNRSAIKVLEYSKQRTNSEVINNILNNLIDQQLRQNEVYQKANNSFTNFFFNAISTNKSMIFNIISGATNAIAGSKSTIIISIAGIAIWLAIRYGFLAAAEIGRARYFLEQRRYYGSTPERILYPYRKRRTLHVSFVLLVKNAKLMLWSFTIVGYFIKYYQYSMIPYILAENPNIGTKEAFTLSKELTQGDKRNLFKISLEIIGWHILGLVTFNLTNIFLINPYEYNLFAEAYVSLRKEKYTKLSHRKLLNDEKLFIAEPRKSEYVKKVPLSKFIKRADKDYSPSTYILLFFIFSIVGWVYEVLLHLINEGTFVNRGTMYGPWLPIYGTGGVAILYLLQRFRKKPILLFVSSFVLCGIIEYTGGWLLFHFKNSRYWDYSNYVLNINGFICLESLLVFGLGGCGFTYIAGPALDDLIRKLDPKSKYILCAFLITAFVADFVVCQTVGQNSGKGIGGEVSAINNTTNT